MHPGGETHYRSCGQLPHAHQRQSRTAAVLVAVQKGITEIVTDSASSLFQIRNAAIEPNGCTPPFAEGSTQGHCKSYPILTFYRHFLQGETPLWYYWQWGCRLASTQSSSQSKFWHFGKVRLHHYICLKGHLSGSLEKAWNYTWLNKRHRS